MTQLNDKDRKVQMEDMKSFDEQMPCVGIFWYDPEEHSFFGVHKKELTPKMVEEAAEKGVLLNRFEKERLLNSGRIRYFSAQNVLNESRNAEVTTTFDIFLSHSSKDQKMIAGLALALKDMGYSVYVD